MSTTTVRFRSCRQFGNGGEVGDDHRGVCGSLHVNHFRVRLDRLLHLFEAGSIDVAEFQAELDQELSGEPENAAIDRLGQDRVVPGTQETKHRINGRHARK